MISQNIINTIYSFYPRNVEFDDFNSFNDSQEYLNRVKMCRNAVNDNANWISFKNELTEYSLLHNGSRLYDYSMLGNVPCYHGSLKYDKLKPQVISVLISVIIPLWAYRIFDSDESLTVRYQFNTDEEEKVVKKLQSLVNRYYPKYESIEEVQHQLVISDISTAFKSSPTIFEAIFTENDN